MEEYAIIKNEPREDKIISADYIRGYDDAKEKACMLYEEALLKAKRTGIHGIPQMVKMFKIALEEHL